MIDKVENPKPIDKLYLILNYRNILEELLGMYLKLMSKVYDHLLDPRHFCYI